MPLTGLCTLGAYFCPYCGYIHRGIIDGGVDKDCAFCSVSNYEDCDVREKIEEGYASIRYAPCASCLRDIYEELRKKYKELRELVAFLSKYHPDYNLSEEVSEELKN